MEEAATDPAAGVAWVALGANVGHRGRALAALRAALGTDGVRIAAASGELLTRPWGMAAQAPFHNQVLRLETDPPLPATEWLRRCRAAETLAGRRPTVRWGPRRADADLLLLGATGETRVALAELQVPHPALGDRPFLCALLAELDPALRHPDGWAFTERSGRYGLDRQPVGQLGDHP